MTVLLRYGYKHIKLKMAVSDNRAFKAEKTNH